MEAWACGTANKKEKADALFNALGFNLTTAVNTFVKQALREQAIPFQPKLKYNAKQYQEMMEAMENHSLIVLAEERMKRDSGVAYSEKSASSLSSEL